MPERHLPHYNLINDKITKIQEQIVREKNYKYIKQIHKPRVNCHLKNLAFFFIWQKTQNLYLSIYLSTKLTTYLPIYLPPDCLTA